MDEDGDYRALMPDAGTGRANAIEQLAFGTIVAKGRYRKAKSTGDMGLAPHCASWWGPRGLRSPHKVNFAGTPEEGAGMR